MLILLILACLLFALLPYDAQLWVMGLLRSIPPEFWVGVIGAMLTSMFWYAAGWGGLAKRQRNAAIEKAEAQYRQDKGWL